MQISMRATSGNALDIAAFTYAHMVKRTPLHLGAKAYAKPWDRTLLFAQACGAQVVYGTATPLYSLDEDVIGMPHWANHVAKHPWRPVRKYCSYLLHELSHWTAHNKRCARALSGEFGSVTYTREEMVAEMSAAFLCWDLALTKRPTFTNAKYVSGWLGNLSNANARVELETALGRANQASAFLLSLARRRGRYGL